MLHLYAFFALNILIFSEDKGGSIEITLPTTIRASSIMGLQGGGVEHHEKYVNC